jgi:hypothetical protein
VDLAVSRSRNVFTEERADGVVEFTLLLDDELVDLDEPAVVRP